MITTWQIRLGDLKIVLHNCINDLGAFSLINSIVTDEEYREEWPLIIIRSDIDESTRCIDLPEPYRHIANEIAKNWPAIRDSHHPRSQLDMIPWIKPWDEYIPTLGLLQYKLEYPMQFLLLSDLTENEGFSSAIDLSAYYLATQWHIAHSGILLHSAAVANNRGGHLFLGRGGAGKSTVAALSATINLKVLSDDLVFVMYDRESDQCELIAAPGLWKTFTITPSIRPLLRGIYVLVKDNQDLLKPLSVIETAQALYRSFTENIWAQYLAHEEAKCAFKIIAAIARIIPGYELHFRKSPEFWDLIDAEFPD